MKKRQLKVARQQMTLDLRNPEPEKVQEEAGEIWTAEEQAIIDAVTEKLSTTKRSTLDDINKALRAAADRLSHTMDKGLPVGMRRALVSERVKQVILDRNRR